MSEKNSTAGPPVLLTNDKLGGKLSTCQ